MHFDQTVPPRSIGLPQATFRDSTWLPAALLATLVLLASALQAFGDEPQLQWRAVRTAQPTTTTQAQPAPNQQVSQSKPVKIAVSNQTDERGYSVYQVSYSEAKSLKLARQGEARLDSLVVHPRDPRFTGTGPVNRVAQYQDPFGDDRLDDELSRDINQPFGEPTQPGITPPAIDTPAIEPPSLDTLPDMDPGLDPGVLPPPMDTEDGMDITPPDGFDMPEDDMNALDPTDDITQPGTQPTFQAPGGQPDYAPAERPLSAREMSKLEQERKSAAEMHTEALSDLRSNYISNIDVKLYNEKIQMSGTEGRDYPFEGSIDDGSLYADREWPEVTYMWKAAANCHKPLYFEQPQLERYGHSWGPYTQPLISGAHFFTRIPAIPYCMGIEPPTECIYPLGHYRPGNCAPYMIPAVPFTWRAALFEAGAVTGTAAILP